MNILEFVLITGGIIFGIIFFAAFLLGISRTIRHKKISRIFEKIADWVAKLDLRFPF